MSTILIAVIIIAVAVIPAAILTRLHKQEKKKQVANLLTRFKTAGAKHNLLFTHQQMLKDKMLGLDAHGQKLLVFAFDKEYKEVLIDLANLQSCTVYREYIPVMMDNNKAAKAEKVLRQLGLNVVFSGTSQSLLIVFYDSWINDNYDVPELENVVRTWKGLMGNSVAEKTRIGITP